MSAMAELETERREARVTRILANLRTHHYDLTLGNVSGINGWDQENGLLSDPGASPYYGNIRNYGDHYQTLSWSVVADMLAEAPFDEFNTPVVFIPNCGYSDYSGSMVEKSNAECLLSESGADIPTDSPEARDNLRSHLRETTGDYGTRDVIMPLVFLTEPKYRGPWVEDLYRTLDALAGYPVLDESLMSEMEWDAINEAIGRYGLFDTGRAAVDIVRKIDDDAADALDNALDPFTGWTVAESENNPFRAWFAEQLSNSDQYPVCEDAAGSVDWVGIDDEMADTIATHWLARRTLPWPAELPTHSAVPMHMTGAQDTALRALCERYGVPYDPTEYRPVFDLPSGWLGGWIGTSIYVGIDPEGGISS